MSIILDTRIDPAAGIPTLRNYRRDVFDDARCTDAWLVAHDTIEQDVGGVSRVASLKTNGIPLTQSNPANRPASYEDPDMLCTVLSFDNAVSKFMTPVGLTWRPDLAFSIVAVVDSTLASGNADLHIIAGDASLPNVAGLATFNTLTGYKTYSGRLDSPTGDAVGRRGWNRIIACCSAAQEPDTQANWNAVGSGASGTANGKSTSTSITIGHNTFRLGGRLMFVGFWNVRLRDAAHAEYFRLINEYISEVTGNFV